MSDNAKKRLASAGFKMLLGGPDACGGGTCPTIYEDKTGDFVIQGYTLTSDEKSVFELPEKEDVVRIPRTLIIDLAAQL